jgi:hypothetical protein
LSTIVLVPMKSIKILFISISFIWVKTESQIIDYYEIAKWHQFKKAAVSYTMDDNCENQLKVAIPLFNEFGFKTTLFVITNRKIDWNELLVQSKNGHEIASHTVSHTPLNLLTTIEQSSELKRSQGTIDVHIKDTKCLSIAYPYCNIGDKNLVSKLYIAGRMCGGSTEQSSPKDFFNISSVVCGNNGTVRTVQAFNDTAFSSKLANKWCIFLLHDIDNDNGPSSTSSINLRLHLEYMNEHRNDYWVGTFKDVVKYIKERDAAILYERVITENCLQVSVTDDLDNNIYDHPISIKRLLPPKWDSAQVYQNNELIPSRILSENQSKWIIFDVVPDRHKIFIVNGTCNLSTEIDSSKSLSVEISPNPFFEYLTLIVRGSFSYFIYTPNGKIAEKGSGHSILKVGRELCPGSYRLAIHSPLGNITSQILKE